MPSKHKAATLPHQAPAQDKPEAPKAKWFLSVLVIASIAVTIVGILLLKDQQQPAVVLSAAQGSSPAACDEQPGCRGRSVQAQLAGRSAQPGTGGRSTGPGLHALHDLPVLH